MEFPVTSRVAVKKREIEFANPKSVFSLTLCERRREVSTFKDNPEDVAFIPSFVSLISFELSCVPPRPTSSVGATDAMSGFKAKARVTKQDKTSDRGRTRARDDMAENPACLSV